MNSDTIELQVKDIVAQMAGIRPESIDSTKGVTDYGIDSLAQLELRETLERVLQVYLPDEAWGDFRSIGDLIGYVSDRRSALEHATMGPHVGGSHSQQVATSLPARGWRLTPSGMLCGDIEIGLPLTGLNNLAESPLLQHLGDLQWSHLSALCGVSSKQIADAEGQRLYPTFFYVEVAFPEDRPMASYAENDRIKVVSTLRRFGGSMLDGECYLLPADYPETHNAPFNGVAPALAAGIPAVRLSNVFIKQFKGAEWLKTSRPANPGFDRIPEAVTAPDSYVAVKQAEKDGYFSLPRAGYVPMTGGPARTEYRLIADRDLNGAGLVYFANYPLFLDICEREVLSSADLPLSDELIDRRTLVRRRSAYLNNASSRDTLVVEVTPWLENPAATGHPSPEMAPIRLFLNYRMYRKSDGRLMLVSTAEKMIFGRPMEEVPFFPTLLASCR